MPWGLMPWGTYTFIWISTSFLSFNGDDIIKLILVKTLNLLA